MNRNTLNVSMSLVNRRVSQVLAIVQALDDELKKRLKIEESYLLKLHWKLDDHIYSNNPDGQYVNFWAFLLQQERQFNESVHIDSRTHPMVWNVVADAEVVINTAEPVDGEALCHEPHRGNLEHAVFEICKRFKNNFRNREHGLNEEAKRIGPTVCAVDEIVKQKSV